MFSEVDFDVVSFKPNDSNLDREEIAVKLKEFRDSSSQTDKGVKDEGSQVKTSRNFELQTEEVVRELNAEYDVDRLATFLSSVFTPLMEELDKVEKSRAFSLYHPSSSDASDNNVKLVHSILSENLPKLPGVRVSCLDWSCTNNVVIVGYESTDHDNWCNHTSSVDFFNINTSDFNGRTPTSSIPTSCCITALAAHPYEPAVLAVGSAEGEVLIWNLQRGEFDAELGNAVFHKERVTKLSWENVSSHLYLVSSSLDSYMYFYKVTPSIGSVQLSDRYCMSQSDSLLNAGILNFSFSVQPGVFVVGLESGEIIHCSVFGAPSIPSISAKNPVLRIISKNVARVIDMKFSPFAENIFVLAFMNNRFEGYSIRETAALFSVYVEHDIFGLAWSSLQSNIVYIWGKSEKISVHRGDTGHLVAELQPESSSLPLIKSVSFCSKSSRLALAGKEGNVMIWDIPSHFEI